MTSTEMYYKILEGINRVGANEEFDYSPTSVQRFLNDEIKNFIKNRMDPDKSRDKKGFEADPIRLADLSTLVAQYDYEFETQTTAPDEYQFLLPDGTGEDPSWLYFAAGEVSLRKGLITRQNVPIYLVRQNVGALLRKHPYARTQTNGVLAMIRKGVFTLG